MVKVKTENGVQENSKGFTLIELVIVLIILAILGVIAVPRFVDLRDRARNAVHSANSGALHSALMLYRAEHGGQAPTVTALADMVTGNNRPSVRGGELRFDDGNGNTYSIQTYSDPLCRGKPNRSSRKRVACLK